MKFRYKLQPLSGNLRRVELWIAADEHENYTPMGHMVMTTPEARVLMELTLPRSIEGDTAEFVGDGSQHHKMFHAVKE